MMGEAKDKSYIEQSEEEEGEIREDSDTADDAPNTKGKQVDPNEDPGQKSPKVHKRKDPSAATERSSHKRLKKEMRKAKIRHHHDEHKHLWKEEPQDERSIKPEKDDFETTQDAKVSHKQHKSDYYDSLQNAKPHKHHKITSNDTSQEMKTSHKQQKVDLYGLSDAKVSYKQHKTDSSDTMQVVKTQKQNRVDPGDTVQDAKASHKYHKIDSYNTLQDGRSHKLAKNDDTVQAVKASQSQKSDLYDTLPAVKTSHKHRKSDYDTIQAAKSHKQHKNGSYDTLQDVKAPHKHATVNSLENCRPDSEAPKRKSSHFDNNHHQDHMDAVELEPASKKRKEKRKQKHHDGTHRKIKSRKNKDSLLSLEESHSSKGEKRHHADGERLVIHERGLKDSPSRQREEEILLDRPIKVEAVDEGEFRRQHDRVHKKDKWKKSDSALRAADDVTKGDSSNLWKGKKNDKSRTQAKEKAKPNFDLSGKLAEDTNVYNGIVIKYNEPPEARKPKRRWRLYPFKGSDALPFIPIHRQSAYLLGRSRLVADIPTDHPSCSKQHAVLQFRLVNYEKEDGTIGRHIRPYVIDLDSSNGTFVNNKPVETRRFVELLEKDVIKFGFSTREYVLLHEESKDEHEDDNILEET